ncbi:MAG: beta-CASP ribonuclease aCPSF1, partial [Nitrososphaerota archaeon]|nr:beta-CASP ribonuclease aCPSF1 [Nitrososphaerota archaeon]
MGNEFSGQNIAAEVLQLLPSKAEVTRIEYEGPRVAIYTKNPSYFMENPYTIGEIVNTLRKRVIVKADETYRKGEEYSRDFLVK